MYKLLLITLLFTHSVANADKYQIWRNVAYNAGITPETLYSIAMVESQSLAPQKKGKVQAWPWTLNSNRYGGQFFKNKEELIEDLNFLIDEGYTNIDIGIMQINWKYNGKRMVGDPIKLLDPKTNIETAGRLLKELMKQNNNDVFLAVAKYHSHNKKRGTRYAQKVMNLSRVLQEQDVF